MAKIGEGDATWNEGQRVRWLTVFKIAIDRCIRGGRRINHKPSDLIGKILDGGDVIIKRHEAAKVPISAD